MYVLLRHVSAFIHGHHQAVFTKLRREYTSVQCNLFNIKQTSRSQNFSMDPNITVKLLTQVCYAPWKTPGIPLFTIYKMSYIVRFCTLFMILYKLPDDGHIKWPKHVAVEHKINGNCANCVTCLHYVEGGFNLL
jgi:hypothetical protein